MPGPFDSPSPFQPQTPYQPQPQAQPQPPYQQQQPQYQQPPQQYQQSPPQYQQAPPQYQQAPAQYQQQQPFPQQQPFQPAAAAQSGLSDNAAGALAYVTPIPAIIFLIVAPYNQNRFVRFHSWQSIILCASAIVIDIVLSIILAATFMFLPLLHLALWPLISLFWIAVWLICVINAAQGKMFKLPIIGAFVDKAAGA